MAIITIDDVLKHAEKFEQMLADFYADLAKHTSRDGVRLLTGYMSRHRVRILDTLGKLSLEQVHRICSTPLQYEPNAADCNCFNRIELADDASAAAILDAAVVLDECLVKLYRQVLQQPLDEEIRAVFEDLLRSEQCDEIELKKIKAMDYF